MTYPRQWLHPCSSSELRFFLLVPIFSLGIGAILNATLVRGDYEWWGIARICYELFDRTGFWCIALWMWAVGVVNGSNPATWNRVFAARLLWAWGAMAGIVLFLAGLQVLDLPAGSFVDFLALCTVLSGVPAFDLARHSRITLGMFSILRSAAAALAVFAAYTFIAYFHTMVKGSLFIMAAANDTLLWDADALLLGKGHYDLLADWRSSHGALVGFLDIAYIGLLQQICWSAFFFHGARDWLNGRRYLVAMFLIYSIGPAIYFIAPSKGPMFYVPDLFRDLGTLAPDTWHLAKFLTWSTEKTLAGIPHEIAPFAFIAALPSVHVGVALIMLLAMRKSLVITLFNAVLLALIVVATNVLGWHYVVDLAAGLGLGALSWVLACRISPLQNQAGDALK